MTLDPEDLAAIRAMMLELLSDSRPPAPWLDVKGAAAMFNVGDDWVYRHAAELGARKVGNRLRFKITDLEAAAPCLGSWRPPQAATPLPTPKAAGRPTRRMGAQPPLLPILGAEVPR
jgi:hypothetical protein